MNAGTATIIRGDATQLPIPDSAVDLIITSPPYFALRSYTDGGEHYEGQIGSEPTPAAFLDALITATAEMIRVLKPAGSIFVNLGDKYSQPGKGERNMQGVGGSIVHKVGKVQPNRSAVGFVYGAPAKSLIGTPWRYAIRCIDDLGLILRAEIIWSKPNGLPESVTDRVRRSHEQWFHFTKQPRYFSAVDEIREPHAPSTAERNAYKRGRSQNGGGSAESLAGFDYSRRTDLGEMTTNTLGKLPGSVWEIATQPLTVPPDLGVDHFAAFPMEWPRRLILGWSPAGICQACGQGLRPNVKRTPMQVRKGPKAGGYGTTTTDGITGTMLAAASAEIVGYTCECPDSNGDTAPAVVLDPFGGTGTTALVAKAHGRHGISIDLSSDYCRLAQWRTTDPAELARAANRPKPPTQTSGQLELVGRQT